MPKKRKVKLTDFELIKDMELQIIHLKDMLKPENKSIPLFRTDFTASGLIPLVLGAEAEKEVTGDVVAFFSKLDVKYKKLLKSKYKELTKQIRMRIVDYDISIEGRDANFDLIEYEDVELIDNGDGTFTDEGGNLCDEEGEILEKVHTVKELE
jgi:hypothetical protein